MASSLDNAVIEDIIRRRLLIDGDGMGDERKLNTLIKSYITFVDGEDAEENDEVAFRRLVNQTKQMEHVVRRTNASIKSNSEAQEIYTDLKNQVQNEIEGTKTQIDQSKVLLEEATKHRKYSMEYDALAKLIESKPDRKLTEVKEMGLELELETLRKRKEKLDQQLEYRKRTVSVMGSTIERLKDLLTVDESTNQITDKNSRNGDGVVLDVDSASQSEPPSPMDQTAPEVVNGLPTSESSKNGSNSGQSGTHENNVDKSKSEKYEDLSESEASRHRSRSKRRHQEHNTQSSRKDKRRDKHSKR